MPHSEPLPALDDLSFDQLDQLPEGVIQLDGAGRITFYNKAESQLSGLSRDRAIGRDFFRDVAPCAHLPAFQGRFVDGVRRGALNADFGFVFDFDPPARVRVRMTGARERDRYWILVRQLAREPELQQIGWRRLGALLRRIAGADDVFAVLADPAPGDPTMLDLFDATGAAVVDGERIAVIGTAPPAAEIARLVDWLRRRPDGEARAFATADLSEHWAEAGAWPRIGSGLLAAAADGERQHLLLWFRPGVQAGAGEERGGPAEPWAPWHADAADAFATAVGGMVLRGSRTTEELSAQQRASAAALAHKDVLIREIDHRIKNSLQFVASVLLLQTRRVNDPDARTAFHDAYGRVMSIARVHDGLRQSDGPDMVDLGETVRRLCDDLTTAIADAARPIDVHAQAGLMRPSRIAVALAMIATELVSNALQHAYPTGEGGPIEVHVHLRGDRLELVVCDEGRGLPWEWDDRPLANRGLGMRVIGAMLEQIGATLSVEAGRARGTCFTVTV